MNIYLKYILIIALGYVGISIFEFIAINIIKKDRLVVLNHRLHHSIYGLLFIIFGFIFSKLFLIFLGIGVMLQHTITDGFRFISKE
jgi:hypothetical protein